jgi:hypothetical protein
LDNPPHNEHRPFYATIWFNLVATAVLIGVLFLVAATVPDVGNRPVKGIGQFGVVLVTIHWVFVFPKLRNLRGHRRQR